MEKEFITYEQALALKELGFDEPCFGRFKDSLDFQEGFYNRQIENTGWCIAPLYQQAFRWFREKHNLQHELCSLQKNSWLITIMDTASPNEHGIYKGKKWDCDDLDENTHTYEEAESACLDKLIEIARLPKP